MYPQPDLVLWRKDVSPSELDVTPYDQVQGGEWWWDPETGELIPACDQRVWLVHIRIDPGEAFLQRGTDQDPTVYWLVARMHTMWGEFGWKTRRWPHPYDEDAVRDYGTELPRLWKELRYPPGHPYHGLERDSIDLAFAITTQPCTPPDPPEPDPTGIDKNRYVSFVPTNPATATAQRVTLINLDGFEGYNRDVLWVGQPADYPEGGAGSITFKAAHVQCDPYYTDWVAELGNEVLHVYGAEIVPSWSINGTWTEYEIQATFDGVVYSTPLAINTMKWGDVIEPFFDPDNPVVQPNFSDVGAIVDKFRGRQYTKARTQLQPNVPDPTKQVDFKDISACVDAFQGNPYPFTGPCKCPSAVTCGRFCTGDGDCPAEGKCVDHECRDLCERCTVPYWNSGCLGMAKRSYPDCGEDEIILTVSGTALRTLHRNATYNCCPDDIVVTPIAEPGQILFTEEEMLTTPCDCMCCYSVGATVLDLEPGEYTVLYCWMDWETGGPMCDEQQIVIP